jgi:hypothetical protein
MPPRELDDGLDRLRARARAEDPDVDDFDPRLERAA